VSNQKEVKRKLLAEVEKHVRSVFTMSQKNIVRNGTSDTGNLLQSGRVTTEKDSVVLTYDTPYAESIEYGKSPGTMPPVDDIRRWAERKLGVQKDKSMQAAYRIAKKIERVGAKPQPFLRPAIQKGLNNKGD